MAVPIMQPVTLGEGAQETPLLVLFSWHPAISPTFFSPGREPHITIERVLDERTADPAQLAAEDLDAITKILWNRHRAWRLDSAFRDIPG